MCDNESWMPSSERIGQAWKLDSRLVYDEYTLQPVVRFTPGAHTYAVIREIVEKVRAEAKSYQARVDALAMKTLIAQERAEHKIEIEAERSANSNLQSECAKLSSALQSAWDDLMLDKAEHKVEIDAERAIHVRELDRARLEAKIEGLSIGNCLHVRNVEWPAGDRSHCFAYPKMEPCGRCRALKDARAALAALDSEVKL